MINNLLTNESTHRHHLEQNLFSDIYPVLKPSPRHLVSGIRTLPDIPDLEHHSTNHIVAEVNNFVDSGSLQTTERTQSVDHVPLILGTNDGEFFHYTNLYGSTTGGTRTFLGPDNLNSEMETHVFYKGTY